MTPLLLALLAAAQAAPAPAQAAPVRAAPTVPLHRLITVDDYPMAAIRAGEQGVVRVALDVAAEGRVTTCTILASSRSAILDSSTCRLLRARARFTPARDSSGKAVPDRHETAVVWKTGPAAAVQVPPPVEAAAQDWLACLRPAIVSGLVDPSLPVRPVAEKAFPACRAAEDRLLAAMTATLGAPDVPPEQQRTRLRDHFITSLDQRRGAEEP